MGLMHVPAALLCMPAMSCRPARCTAGALHGCHCSSSRCAGVGAECRPAAAAGTLLEDARAPRDRAEEPSTVTPRARLQSVLRLSMGTPLRSVGGAAEGRVRARGCTPAGGREQASRDARSPLKQASSLWQPHTGQPPTRLPAFSWGRRGSSCRLRRCPGRREPAPCPATGSRQE